MVSLLHEIFRKKGIDTEFFEKIEDTRHKTLKSLPDLAAKLYDARLNGLVVTILPDFDCDGIMAGLIGYLSMLELGFNVRLYTSGPKYGYGFSKEVIDELLEQHPDTDVIITCDTGISCLDGIAYAKERGLTVYVTDHHPETERSSADIIVNPLRLDEEYEHFICGAHVFYQLFMYYVNTYEPFNKLLQERIGNLALFAGIATISDMMPVLYENRALIRHSLYLSRILFGDFCYDKDGIKLFESDGETPVFANYFEDSLNGATEQYKNAFQNYREMLHGYYEYGKIADNRSIYEDFYGFYLAPTINSLKRLEENSKLAYDCFLSDRDLARASFEKLIALNERRKNETLRYFDILLQEIEDGTQKYAPYIYITEASAGFAGLLATKIMQKTGIPSIVVTKVGNCYKGSGRSLDWYPFKDRLLDAKFFAGGHTPSFGVAFESIHELKAAYAFINQDIQNYMPTDVEEVSLVECFDYVLDLSNIDKTGFDYDIVHMFKEYARDINKYGPFGRGFSMPKIAVSFKVNPKKLFFMGDNKDYVKYPIAEGLNFLCFDTTQAMLWKDLKEDHVVVCDVSVSVSTFREKTTVSLSGTMV